MDRLTVATVTSSLTSRTEWSDEQFEILATHPDREVRVLLAQTRHVTPEQRARLVEDPDPRILDALAEGLPKMPPPTRTYQCRSCSASSPTPARSLTG